ncbi:MAG: NAD+ synthase [Bacteroidales bacterium]|nr:NAD+ synthase [Bacteroidales bacterium]MDZ4205465.1 NAD+ synthase [Bacteroidales bacterium]
MKIALAQLNFLIGDFENNTLKIKNYIRKANDAQADLVVFSELCIPGYPSGDFLEFDHFIQRCQASVQSLAAECQGITAIIGCPVANPNPRGKLLFNAAIVLHDSKIHSVVHKTLLPNYDVFDEHRYFEPNTVFHTIDLPYGRLAITICEDLWSVGDHALYTLVPMGELIKQQPDIIINIAASPFHYRQSGRRREVFSRNAAKYSLPLISVNQVGGQAELLFDGESMVFDSAGRLVGELDRFHEDFKIFDTTQLREVQSKEQPSDAALIHDALVMGIRDYFSKMGFNKSILGLSGGIDSALVLALAAQALGAENVMSLLLPSEFSTQHSMDDALDMLSRLGTPHEVIEIKEPYQSFLSELTPYFSHLPFDITEENLQARIRAVTLMAFANKFGCILLNTSNKSEASVGYGTLYGDMCGGLSVLGDVYKTQVYDLANYINRNKEIIPQNIIRKPPSAELRPNQKDTDSLPEYEILDKILFEYIENSRGPDQIISMGFDYHVVLKVLRMVNINEWKRYQTPPILRVSSKAFGPGRRMPLVTKYLCQ